MIMHLIKNFFKIAALLILGGIFALAVFKGTVDYVKNPDEPYDDVSYMIKSYEKNAEADFLSYCQCPVCNKYFIKDNTPCCNSECEKNYWNLANAWESVQDEKLLIESFGKKFR